MSLDKDSIITYLKQTSEGEAELPLEMTESLSEEQPLSTLSNVTIPEVITPKSKLDLSGLNSLEEVSAIAHTCTLCPLSRGRNKVVFGVGNPHARLMFIGEGPGADEDRLGEPFVGRAGQLLTKIITAMKLSREEVYITNVVKCRPPNNRNPELEEATTCLPYLHKQVELVNPEFIVLLGLVASTYMIQDPAITIRDLRAKEHSFHGKPMFVTYHPAALLRNPALKRPVWEDMQKVMKLLGISE